MESNIKNKAFSGMIWRFLERSGAQIVNFLVQIILARLLAPELYGTIALVTVFTTILQVFVDSGMGNALIQKKNADDVDFSSVFYFNIVMCVVLYVGMYCAAPIIAEFYKDNQLIAVVRVMSLTLVISGIKNVQQAYVSKTMQFKRFFYATSFGTIAAAVVGVSMAYMEFGVWALVAQELTNNIIGTIVLWFTVKWRPKWLFSFNRLKGLISYGWKLLASGVIDTVYNNIRQLVIGKFYTSSDLGLYNQGKKFPYVMTANINASIDSVLLPVLSAEQDNKDVVKRMARRAIRMSSYLIWPLMVGLGVCAEPIVRVLLTDKWLGSVPYLQIFCFTYAFWPIHTTNLNAIKAVGRSDIYLKLEIIKKIIGIISIIVSVKHGVMVIALVYAATAPISALVNAYPNRKLLKYGYIEQIKDMLPAMIMSAIMGTIVYPIIHLNLNSSIIILLIQVIAGGTVYIALSYLTRNETFFYLLDIIKNKISNRR